jgi:hypothetical protein
MSFAAEPAVTAFAAAREMTSLSEEQARTAFEEARGSDLLESADSAPDRVFCGAGDDVAIVDPIDRVRGCERTSLAG